MISTLQDRKGMPAAGLCILQFFNPILDHGIRQKGPGSTRLFLG